MRPSAHAAHKQAMTDTIPLRIWAAGACLTGGYGGWAFVRVRGTAASGAAGGQRKTSAPRMALAGLVEALAAPEPDKAPVVLHTASAHVLTSIRSLAGWRAAGWKDADGQPIPDADLWEQLAQGLSRFGPAKIVRLDAPGTGKDAVSFVDGWASLAADKVKGVATFRAVIPKPNLAKFPGT